MSRDNWGNEFFGKSYVGGNFMSFFDAMSHGMDGGAMRGDMSNESAGMRGWNWTAVHLKAMQFSTAELDIFVSQSLKREIEKVFGVQEKTANGSVQSSQSENIPDGYEIAPSLYGLQKLMRKPNRWIPGSVWQYQLGQHLEVFGVAFALVIPGSNNCPTEMYLIPKPLIDFWPFFRDSIDGGYRVGQLVSGGFKSYSTERAKTYRAMLTKIQNRIYPAEWVIEIGVPHPFWIDDWSNPTDAMSDALQTDLDLNKTRRSVLQNQMMLGPRLSVKPGTVLDANQKEAYLAEMQARNAGPGNAGKSSFDPDGISIETAQYNAKEMEYRASVVDSRDTLLGHRLVSPSMVGLNDASSYASMVATSRVFSRYAMQPIMNMVSDQLCIGLQRWYNSPYDEFSLRLMASTIDDPQLKETQIANDLKSFALKKGEYRKMRQLEPLGDERDEEIAGVNSAAAMPGAPGVPGMPGAPGAGPQMPGQPGEAAGASATGIGAAVNPADSGAVAPETKAAAEYASISRQQFARNSKATKDILYDVRDGEMPAAVAVEMLGSIGYDTERAQRMIDAAVAGNPGGGTDGAETKEGVGMVLKGLPTLRSVSDASHGTGKSWFGANLTGLSRRAVKRASVVLVGKGCLELLRDPHLTVLYPILDGGPETLKTLRRIASGFGPVGCHFTHLEILGDADEESIVARVESPDLEILQGKVSQSVSHSSRHITFRPHVTLARCAVGHGAKLISGLKLGLENVVFQVKNFRVVTGDSVSIVKTSERRPTLEGLRQKSLIED